MAKWYECKLSYETTNTEGKRTNVNENYLVDAVNLTDAETILTKEVSSNLTQDFKIETVKSEKIYEIIYNKIKNEESNDANGVKFYKAKVAFIIIDEEKEKEKRVNSTIYVQSEDIDYALKNLRLTLKDSMCDYEILSLTKSKILDVVAPSIQKKD